MRAGHLIHQTPGNSYYNESKRLPPCPDEIIALYFTLPPMNILSALKQRGKQLKTETYAVYLAYRHPHTPWYAKAFLMLVLAYALSPVDLIPDFIPVLGYLDDIIIVPAGIFLALKMIPGDVMRECRERAGTERITGRIKWIGLTIVVFIWLVILAAIGIAIYKIVS